MSVYIASMIAQSAFWVLLVCGWYLGELRWKASGRIVEHFGPLGAIGQRHDQRESIAFDLLPDLAPKVFAFAFVEPDHDACGGKNRSGPCILEFNGKPVPDPLRGAQRCPVPEQTIPECVRPNFRSANANPYHPSSV